MMKRNVRMTVLGGYDLDERGAIIRPPAIDTTTPGDYGADPIGDGMHRMVPSGDIVTYEERLRRLDEHKRRLSHGSWGSSD